MHVSRKSFSGFTVLWTNLDGIQLKSRSADDPGVIHTADANNVSCWFQFTDFRTSGATIGVA